MILLMETKVTSSDKSTGTFIEVMLDESTGSVFGSQSRRKTKKGSRRGVG